MNPTLAMIFGLATAACWGAGDFGGGYASRRNHVYLVVLVVEGMGVVLALLLALLLGETLLPWRELLWGLAAGWSGVMGLIALYKGLAEGSMGIVAPVSSLVGGIVPVITSAFLEGLPGPRQMAGFALALVAVVLISWSKEESGIAKTDLRLPILAGIGFGFYFVFLHRMSENAILVPLAAARSSSLLLVAFVVARSKEVRRPALADAPVLLLAGLFDNAGTAFFALAARSGRLDMSSILASLYPAVTVLLARVILKERLTRQQIVGVAGAMFAILLITP